jgi:hypothetical protein
MTPVDRIRRTPAGTTSVSRRPSAEWTSSPDDSRALVVVQPVQQVEPPRIGSNRASASFLAQLIAIDQQAPQTRVRRRAGPEQASRTYRAASALTARVRPLLLTKVC